MTFPNNNTTSLISLKQTAKNNIKLQFGVAKTVPYIGIIAINDKKTRDFIIEGISQIGLSAVVLDTVEDFKLPNISSTKKINSNNLIGFDFFIYDNDFEGVDVVKYMGAGIVPIMPEKNTFSGILKDFDPMKFEGNGFFYKKINKFCIFEKMISYLENIKFPEDNRVLLKNVSETF